jgi:hypothetical protein
VRIFIQEDGILYIQELKICGRYAPFNKNHVQFPVLNFRVLLNKNYRYYWKSIIVGQHGISD